MDISDSLLEYGDNYFLFFIYLLFYSEKKSRLLDFIFEYPVIKLKLK